MQKRTMSSSDARCLKNRTIRNPWHCTICGVKLPEKRKDWGLVWNNDEQGACVNCIHTLRVSFGFRYALDLNAVLDFCFSQAAEDD